jgi:hypothetical protein
MLAVPALSSSLHRLRVKQTIALSLVARTKSYVAYTAAAAALLAY